MFVETAKPAPAESGLAALVLLLRLHGVGADAEQIRHRFGDDIGVKEMLRCAKEFGLKARVYRSKWRRLANTPLPGIAVLRDGRYLLLGKAGEDQVILFNRSIRDNIALAQPATPIESVIAAATLAGAHDFILELPKGYDTVVGERGGSLSGGQRHARLLQ